MVCLPDEPDRGRDLPVSHAARASMLTAALDPESEAVPCKAAGATSHRARRMRPPPRRGGVAAEQRTVAKQLEYPHCSEDYHNPFRHVN
jgi:hypothetical protein